MNTQKLNKLVLLFAIVLIALLSATIIATVAIIEILY